MTDVSRRTLRGGALGAAVTSASVAVSRAGAARPSTAASASAPPVLCIGHGSPLFADLPGNAARVVELRAWGAALPKPRAILVMTPHYAAQRLELGATGRGFAMYNLPWPLKRRLPPDLEYETPPSEDLAARVEAALGGASQVGRASNRRGFDHTTWMPLLCLFPTADVPVLELTYPYVAEAEAFALGQRLAPLRSEGVMVVASGGMTHNLASSDLAGPPPGDLPSPQSPPATPRWASDFDAWATEAFTARNVDALVDWRRKAPASELAHPDDGGHYRVFLVALGAALGGARTATHVRFPVTGFESTLSKRCVELS